MMTEIVLSKFDYNAPAELFPARNRKTSSKIKYRRFDSVADAIRFAVEEMPQPLLLGAFIEVKDTRLGHADIRELYDSEDFPLKRALN
jgi:hypothetical protein